MNRFFPLLFLIVFACQSKKQKKEDIVEERSTIELVDFENQPISLDAEVTILNLWATWCKPCIAEMPDLVEMQKKLPDEFQLLMASDEPLERQLRFLNKYEFDLSFTQLNTSLEGLGVYALPTTLILDAEGNIIETMVGARKWDTPEQIEKILTFQK